MKYKRFMVSCGDASFDTYIQNVGEIQITDIGILVLRDTNGEIFKTWAPGAWVKCLLVEEFDEEQKQQWP